ncbi:MAG: tetratricopeptide repeat protein [Deltaproteobacteria bacterium]|jgi:hypothetical protein|nr:tetratricopeptide repeat protein [Deltaproteobacteria bacterium]
MTVIFLAMMASAALAAFTAMPLHAAGGKKPGKKNAGGGKRGPAKRSTVGRTAVPKRLSGRGCPPGWPKWPFQPEGPALDDTREEGERLALSGEVDVAKLNWCKLEAVFLTAYGEEDARVWTTLSREARCQLEEGECFMALAESTRALKGLRSSCWQMPVGAGIESRMAILGQAGQEVAFAYETQCAARESVREILDSGDGKDDLAAVFCFAGDDALFPGWDADAEALLSYFIDDDVDEDDDAGGGDGDGDGNGGDDGSGGGGEFGRGGGAVGWDAPEGEGHRAERLAALRGELERAESRSDAGSAESAAARYRYARALAGEWGPETGYDDPDVPREDLLAALELCEGLPEALAGVSEGSGRLDALRLLGFAAYRIEQFDWSEDVRSKALKEAEAMLGPEHPTSLVFRCELAESLVANGNGEYSPELISSGTEGLVSVSDRHPGEAARASVLLSRFSVDHGDPVTAVAVRFAAAGILEKLFGRDHRGAVELRAAGAKILRDTGDYRAAAAVQGACAESAARAAGPGDLRTLAFADRHVLTLYLAKDVEAEGAARKTLSARRAPGGPTGPEAEVGLSNSLMLLGLILLDAGEPGGAYEAFADECIARARSHGPGHRFTLTALDRKARAAEEMGDIEGALALHRETLMLRTENLGPDDPDTLESREAVKRLSRKGKGKGKQK